MSSSTQIKSQGPGRPKDMEKRAAILAAAKALFIRNAFAGTSMDAIAADAGVSKLTVYSHFGDKDNLFREVIRSRIQDLLPEETYSFDPKTDIREVLMRVALTHAHLDCNAETVGTFRAILSDCRQGNPRYGKLMWEEGATRTHGLMERLPAGHRRRAARQRAVPHPDQGQPDDAPDVRLHRLHRQLRRGNRGDGTRRRRDVPARLPAALSGARLQPPLRA